MFHPEVWLDSMTEVIQKVREELKVIMLIAILAGAIGGALAIVIHGF